MHLISGDTLAPLLATYGYYLVALAVMGESAGLPLPGETVLVSAAIYAGTGRSLDIRGVILAAVAGAILGDNIGFWVGRRYGERLLARFGPRIGLDERRQQLGHYLFRRYGGAIVFFGRFVALLRTLAALLAGINGLPPLRFLAYNAAGAIVWSLVFGIGGYLLGHGIERIEGPVGYGALALGVLGAVVGWRYFRRHEERLLAAAAREAGGRPPLS